MAVQHGNHGDDVSDRHLPESTVTLLGALLLFLLPIQLRPFQPTLAWAEASRIDWGTILLFGGGLALGDLMFRTGLADWIGRDVAALFQAKSELGLVMLFTGVAIAVARAAGVSALPVALAACRGASLGFMLPVSTPPNAIVYGSGCIPITKMIRYGLLLDVVGFFVIVLTVTWLVPVLLTD